MRILLLMLLAHVIDDFVFQPQALSDLKQKDWWWKWGLGKGICRFDYIIALIIHSLSWSIMVTLPLIILVEENIDYELGWMVMINTVLHAIIDHLKANLKVINLWIDQVLHIIQVLVIYHVCYYVC